MNKINRIFDHKPAKFPSNNTEEVNAVIKFLDIIKKDQIKADPNFLDKFPNTDGYCTLTEIDQHPIGKIEIQIKTLPDSNINSPKYQCELSFLSHCEISLLPVILIAVNVNRELAYWLHIDRGTLLRLSGKIKGKTISVSFPKDNLISRSNHDYVEKWIDIVNLYIQKMLDSQALESNKKKSESLYELLDNFPKPKHTISGDDLKMVNIFSDALNNSYDNEFKSIKELVYPGFWKISVAYTDFTNSSVSITLIPIKYGDNNLLIREVSNIKYLLQQASISKSIISHYAENPIKSNPFEYANSLIKEETLKVIKNQSLKLGCKQLAIEYLFDFYDFAKTIIPIDGDQNLSISEFKNAMELYFPIWAEEYNKSMGRTSINSHIYFDIEEAIRIKKNHDSISRLTEKRIKNGEYSNFIIVNFSKNISLKYVVHSLNLLINLNIKSIQRNYPKKDKLNHSKFIWSLYNAESAFKKLLYVFKELSSVHDLFINTFFPKLQNELRFYSGFKLLVVNLTFNSEILTLQDKPRIEYYFLDTKDDVLPKTKVYLNNIDCPLIRMNRFDYFENGILIDNSLYFLKSYSGEKIDFLYDKFTLNNFMYKFLYDRFTQYFKTKTG